MPDSLRGAQNTIRKPQTPCAESQKTEFEKLEGLGGYKGISTGERWELSTGKNTEVLADPSAMWLGQGPEAAGEDSRGTGVMSYHSKNPEPRSKQMNYFPEQSLVHFGGRMKESRVSTDTSGSSIQFKHHSMGNHDIQWTEKQWKETNSSSCHHPHVGSKLKFKTVCNLLNTIRLTSVQLEVQRK